MPRVEDKPANIQYMQSILVMSLIPVLLLLYSGYDFSWKITLWLFISLYIWCLHSYMSSESLGHKKSGSQWFQYRYECQPPMESPGGLISASGVKGSISSGFDETLDRLLKVDWESEVNYKKCLHPLWRPSSWWHFRQLSDYIFNRTSD